MPKGKAITVRFSPEEMEALEQFAQKDNRPVANLIYHAAMVYIEAKKMTDD